MINKLIEKHPELESCREDISLAVETLCNAFEKGNKVLVCGNGGSAADAEHIVGELMKGFMSKRNLTAGEKQILIGVAGETEGKFLGENLQKALPAISLVSSVSLATAFANDVSPDLIFAQQVYGLGSPGDVFIGISTSGSAKNVLHAAHAAKAKNIVTIALTGKSGGKLKSVCDLTVCVPSDETPDIQELHLPVYHYICKAVEANFFETLNLDLIT